MITVERIKEREELKREQQLKKKQKEIKKVARRILYLRARGIDSFKSDSRLGDKVYELDGLSRWDYKENILAYELRQQGVKLELSEYGEIIKIII